MKSVIETIEDIGLEHWKSACAITDLYSKYLASKLNHKSLRLRLGDFFCECSSTLPNSREDTQNAIQFVLDTFVKIAEVKLTRRKWTLSDKEFETFLDNAIESLNGVLCTLETYVDLKEEEKAILYKINERSQLADTKVRQMSAISAELRTEAMLGSVAEALKSSSPNAEEQRIIDAVRTRCHAMNEKMVLFNKKDFLNSFR